MPAKNINRSNTKRYLNKIKTKKLKPSFEAYLSHFGIHTKSDPRVKDAMTLFMDEAKALGWNFKMWPNGNCFHCLRDNNEGDEKCGHCYYCKNYIHRCDGGKGWISQENINACDFEECHFRTKQPGDVLICHSCTYAVHVDKTPISKGDVAITFVSEGVSDKEFPCNKCNVPTTNCYHQTGRVVFRCITCYISS